MEAKITLTTARLYKNNLGYMKVPSGILTIPLNIKSFKKNYDHLFTDIYKNKIKKLKKQKNIISHNKRYKILLRLSKDKNKNYQRKIKTKINNFYAIIGLRGVRNCNSIPEIIGKIQSKITNYELSDRKLIDFLLKLYIL